MRTISAKWIPKCLSVDHKHGRIDASRSTDDSYEKDADLLSRITFLRPGNKAAINGMEALCIFKA